MAIPLPFINLLRTPISGYFYEVSADTLPIVKYLDENSEQYYITTLLTFPGSGLSGKDAGYADNRPHAGKVIYSNLQETKEMWTTLLIANHSDIFDNGDIYSLTVDAIKTALILRKTVICAARLKPDDLNEFVLVNDHNDCQFIYLPGQENLPLSLDKGRLYCPIAPILFVGGLLEEANILEAFLSISGRLQSDNFNVVPISANVNCGLAGITTFSQLTYSEGIDEVQKVYKINNLVKKIEEDKQPDLFIIHLPGVMMEYNEIIPNGFGLFSYIISKALTPDFFICCMPCELANSKFISAVSEGIVSRFGFQIDYVHISNAIVDGAMIFGEEALTVVYTTQEDVNNRVTQLRSNSQIPAFNLLNNRDLDLLCEDINKQIKENQRAKILF